MEDCLFCKIAAGMIPTKFIFAGDEIVAFRDINPRAPHHILIIPKKHISTIDDLEVNDSDLVGGMIVKAGDIARELGIAEKGYRLVFNCRSEGGQEVYHIHLHLLGGRQMKWPPG